MAAARLRCIVFSVRPVQQLVKWHHWLALVHPRPPCSKVIFLEVRQQASSFVFRLGVFAMLVGQERVFFPKDYITNSFFLFTQLLLTDRAKSNGTPRVIRSKKSLNPHLQALLLLKSSLNAVSSKGSTFHFSCSTIRIGFPLNSARYKQH